MHQAMANAEVGDDVYGEDPSVNALQEEAAALLGKEAALFVPSGTMANQIALRVRTQHGDEVIAHPNAHIVRAESAAGAALAGVQFRVAGNDDGTLPLDQVEAMIQSGDDPHFAPTALICVENTQNFTGGRVIGLEYLEQLAALAGRHKVGLHLDGARVLNAAVALDIHPERLTAPFQSTTLCFSKGLGAPVGSVVAGSREFITKAKRYRKMYGGGMRQAGFLAQAARHALAHHVERLSEDHANAKRLAEGLAAHPAIELVFGMPETNIVFFRLKHKRLTMPEVVAGMRKEGVLIGGSGPYNARVVTHLDVSRDNVEQALKAMQKVLA